MLINTLRQNIEELFFLTATVYGVKNLFIEPSTSGIALATLDQMRQEKKLFIYAFVILPAHIYGIIQPRFRKNNEITEEFDLKTTEQILTQLKHEDRGHVFSFLSVHRNSKLQTSIWQGIHGLKINSKEGVLQKLDFIHNAPLDKQSQINHRADYRYSSAGFYDRGEKPLISLDDIRELLG